MELFEPIEWKCQILQAFILLASKEFNVKIIKGFFSFNRRKLCTPHRPTQLISIVDIFDFNIDQNIFSPSIANCLFSNNKAAMESILEQCESSDEQNSFSVKSDRESEENSEATETKPIEPSPEKEAESDGTEKESQDDTDIRDFEQKPSADDVESSENTTEDTEVTETTEVTEATDATEGTEASELIDIDSKSANKDDHKDMNISFDEDIILPSVRHDPEQEQKQRDRIKRKEMKSRKELEEEEREKMQ